MGNFTWEGWQSSGEDAPQPNSILYGKKLKTDEINNRTLELVEEIMSSQEQKAPMLADKQRRLLEKLKSNPVKVEKQGKIK
jgi:hypothetical protein